MSLPKPTEILSKIAQFQAEITNEQNIFDEANRVRKSLQEDIENKRIELESLKEHWQEQDNDALKSLTKLWQQQAEIKKQLSDWSENGIKKAIEEQTTTLKTQLNEIESKYKGIRTEISAREKFNLFLQGNIDLIDQDTRAEFSQLVGEGDKQELLKENSQDITALNAMIIDLEKEHESLTKQERELGNYSLADNLAYNTELQKLFEERQTDITKKIDNIISQQDDSELKRQYESIKSQEEEIKFIQNKIEEKNQIIKQTKQKEEELLAKLEQLQQESLIPQFSSKQEREEIVNQYPILQERANDIAASIERQIELNKLNELIKQQGEEIRSEKNKADSLAQQLEKLTLSTNKEIAGNLILIKELREKIKGLEKKKERQFITSQNRSWADELKEAGEPNKLVQLEKQIGELTEENDGLKASLKTLETLSAEKDDKLKVVEEGYRKELSKQLAQTSIDVAKLQVVNEELSTLKIQTDNLTKENDGLKASLKTLETLSAEKDKELKVAEENHKEELNRQSQQIIVGMAELREVSEKLSNLQTQLESEQQGRQEDLERKQQELNKSQKELVGVREELNKAKALYEEKSNQDENLQTQVDELTKAYGDLQNELEVEKEKHKEELKKQSEQAEAGVTELREVSEKLSNLQTQLESEQQDRQEELEGKQKIIERLQESLSVESNHSKELQTQVDKLATDNSKLQDEINVAEEKHKEEFGKQLVQTAIDVAKLQAANDALLQGVIGDLSQLKSEQQERQEELSKSQKELSDARDEVNKTKELYEEKSNQDENLQTQVGELTNAQQQFTIQLAEAKNQLEILSAEKDDKLKAAEERHKEKLNRQSQQAEAKLLMVNEELSTLKVQTDNLTKENGDLKISLEAEKNALETLSAEKDDKLKAAEEKHKEELKKQSDQAEVGVTELREVSEKLSNLQTQLESEQQDRQEELKGKQKIVEELQESLLVESNHSKELQTQVDKLATDNSKLQDEINVAEEKHKEEFGKQLVQTAIDVAKLQAANDALLQGVIGDLSQLKSEQQERQEELNISQEELANVSKELNKTKALYEEKSNQAKNLQTQVGELTNAQQQFTTKLEEAEKNAKNQLGVLSVEKDLVYNKLKAEKDRLENELDKQSKVVVEQAQENRKNASRITELESQNAALLAQLASLNVKVETSAVGMQTDEVLSNEMRSVGTGTEPVMGSGVSTKEAMTNTTEVIIQEQAVSPITERQTIDRVLVHDNNDDKILQAFKKLSRDQVQPIIDKCGLESGSNFAKFAKEDVNKLSEVFQDTQILRDIENIEQKGYADIHKEFASEYKDIIWQSKDAEKSFNLQQNGKDVAIISEKQLSYDNDVEYKTSDGKSIKNARTVNIPLSMDIKGSCHMSFAVQDTNGRNISKENAVYLTAHYNNGKLVHLTKPTEIFACSDDKNSPLYLKRDGKIYTLPVNKYALEQLEKEVLKNKGEYVGIVKNASGAIVSINSGAFQEERSDRLKDDATFKIASQVLHANASHTTNSPIDRKVLPKKHNQYANKSSIRGG